jgi:N-acetyl-gamma-glutamyl-phosphate reductase
MTATSHFSWRANNVQAYKTLTHQHLAEIGESLEHLQKSKAIELNFVPWRGDFTRGIFASSTLHCELPSEELFLLFENFYRDHPFTHVSRQPIFLKQVVNTNRAIIHLEKAGSKLVVHTATDNLLKGASGQAVQNMNLMFNLGERTGLMLKANYF